MKDIKKDKDNEETEVEVFDELEELKQQVQNFENNYKRALADYQNLQKRVQEEKSEWIRSANKELLLRILTVLDTLILAYQHTQDINVQVSMQQFLDVLKAEGVTKIESVGQEFNPQLMECITTEPGEDNKVLEEIRVGFMMYDKILRPAQVKVGKGK
ncbi:MAG TPA: nucleotide exchange factor GrpE [Candidatus Sulfotelmatobacter sp.]|jgi:molecular chaperone GrpE|nr:nucleotide exchange factor GrpE [Candidatus Sulfotelmatobacter sp.]